jgi:hypothetical protein
LYKTKIEAKKSANKVLYFLLEFRFSVLNTLVDPAEETKLYFEHCANKLSKQGITINLDEHREGPVYEMIYEHIQNINSATKINIRETILVPFELALLDFAAISPVLAYQLRGKEKMEDLIAHTNNYAENFQDVIAQRFEQDWLKNAVTSGATEVKGAVLSDLVHNLNNDILLLARHCGRSEYRLCKKLIKHTNQQASSRNFSELDNYFEIMLEQIVQGSQKQELP